MKKERRFGSEELRKKGRDILRRQAAREEGREHESTIPRNRTNCRGNTPRLVSMLAPWDWTAAVVFLACH